MGQHISCHMRECPLFEFLSGGVWIDSFQNLVRRSPRLQRFPCFGVHFHAFFVRDDDLSITVENTNTGIENVDGRFQCGVSLFLVVLKLSHQFALIGNVGLDGAISDYLILLVEDRADGCLDPV